MKRYLVLSQRTPGFQPYALQEHYAFLEKLRNAELLEMAGQFSDKSGGAYLLRASDVAEATALAQQDPLHLRGFARASIYEWQAQ